MSQRITNDNTQRMVTAANLAQSVANHYVQQRSKRDKLSSNMLLTMSENPDDYAGADVTIGPEGITKTNQKFLDAMYKPKQTGSRQESLKVEPLFSPDIENEAIRLYSERLKETDPLRQKISNAQARLLGMPLITMNTTFDDKGLPAPDTKTIPVTETIKEGHDKWSSFLQLLDDYQLKGISTKDAIPDIKAKYGIVPDMDDQTVRDIMGRFDIQAEDNKANEKKLSKEERNKIAEERKALLSPLVTSTGFNKNVKSEKKAYEISIGEEKHEFKSEGKQSYLTTKTPAYTDYFNDPAYKAMNNAANIATALGNNELSQRFNDEKDRYAEYIIKKNIGPQQSIQTLDTKTISLITNKPSAKISENIGNANIDVKTNYSPGGTLQNKGKFISIKDDSRPGGTRRVSLNEQDFITDTGQFDLDRMSKKEPKVIQDVLDRFEHGKFTVSNSNIINEKNEIVATINKDYSVITIEKSGIFHKDDLGKLSSYEDVSLGTD